jgi:predicted PurR-regulated permease PerM
VGCQSFGKLVDVRRLPTLMPAHVDGIPHEQQRYFTISDDLGERGHIAANVGSFERGKALRGDAQWIAERESDALFPQIEGQNSPFYCIFLVLHASFNYSVNKDLALLTPVVTTARKPASSRGVGILALGVGIALLYYGRIFFVTVVIAAIISFLLDPAVVFFMKLKMPRGLASFVVCSLGLMFLYLAGLGIYTEGLAMLNDLPAYGERINALVDGASGRIDNAEKGLYKTLMPKRFQEETQQAEREAAARSSNNKKKKAEPLPVPAIQEVRVRPEPTPLVTYAYGYLSSFYSVLLMASFVPFLVYFQLSWGDHLRTRVLYLFDGADRHVAGRALASVAEMVRAYVIGNFLLGVLLSICSSLLFASVKLPYWLVAGPLSGFLSLIPYIGLPLALAPPLVAALPMNTGPELYLFLCASVALLHLFALNLLYPKFVGARVHLNPLVVTLALMFWGMLWGGIGLVLAIPLTAAIKAVCDNVGSLQAYGKLLGD